VANLLAEAQGFSEKWAQQQTANFQQLAQGYLPKAS